MVYTDRPLTDLEGAVLGLVWERGPCTGYAVRKVFLESSNFQWSASRGAIYPVLERLAARGLVRGRQSDVGRRPGRCFSIAPKGRVALARWVDQPDNPRLFAAPPDPLRTRLPFMAVLTPARRKRVLLKLRERMHRELSRYEEGGDARERLSDTAVNRFLADGVRASLVSRLDWLDRVLESGPRGGGDPSGGAP